MSANAFAKGVSDESEIGPGESETGSGESETGLGESHLKSLIICWMDFVGRDQPCLLTFEVVAEHSADMLLSLHRHCKTVKQL